MALAPSPAGSKQGLCGEWESKEAIMAFRSEPSLLASLSQSTSSISGAADAGPGREALVGALQGGRLAVVVWRNAGTATHHGRRNKNCTGGRGAPVAATEGCQVHKRS